MFNDRGDFTESSQNTVDDTQGKETQVVFNSLVDSSRDNISNISTNVKIKEITATPNSGHESFSNEIKDLRQASKEKYGNRNMNTARQECNNLKNLVKQSVDGLNNILKMDSNKSAINVNGSCRNLNGPLPFDIIKEEEINFGKNMKKEYSAIGSGKGIGQNANQKNTKQIHYVKKSRQTPTNPKELRNKNTKILKNDIASENPYTYGIPRNEKSNISNKLGSQKNISVNNKSLLESKLNQREKCDVSFQTRTKSANRRYTRVDKEEDKSVIESNTSKRDKSPISNTKAFQLKPKSRLVTERGQIQKFQKAKIAQAKPSSNYYTELKQFAQPHSSGISNSTSKSKLNTSTNNSHTSRNYQPNLQNDGASSSVNINYYINKQTNIFPEEIVKMKIQFEEMTRMLYILNNTITTNNEDMVKESRELFTRSVVDLIESDAPQSGNELVISKSYEYSHDSNNLRRRREERKLKNIDCKSIVKLQRWWRNCKMKEHMDTDSNKKINEELKKMLLTDISKDESYKKVLYHFNQLMCNFNSLTKYNKEFNKNLEDLINLEKNTLDEGSKQSLFKAYLAKELKKQSKKNKNNLNYSNVVCNSDRSNNNLLEDKEKDFMAEKQKFAIPQKSVVNRSNNRYDNFIPVSKSQPVNFETVEEQTSGNGVPATNKSLNIEN